MFYRIRRQPGAQDERAIQMEQTFDSDEFEAGQMVLPGNDEDEDVIRAVSALRKDMWQAGFRPVPLLNAWYDHKSAGKKPFGARWTDEARLNPPSAVEQRPHPDYLNTGILCGEVIAVDIDVDDAAIADAVEAAAVRILGPAPTRRREGSARRAMLYRPAGEQPRKEVVTGTAHSNSNACKVEMLGSGQQLAAVGYHNSGAFLEWDGGLAPGDGLTLAGLGPITDEQTSMFLAEMAILLDAKPAVRVDMLSKRTDTLGNSNGSRPSPNSEASIGDVISALAAIPNDGAPDWEGWKRIGMAAWSATGGSEEGYAAFAAWSAKNPSDDPTQTRRAWDEVTASPPSRIGAGTLFHLAKEANPSWCSPSSAGKRYRDISGTPDIIYPYNFELTESGLYHYPKAKIDEEPDPIRIAPYFEIVGMCRDEDSRGWGIVLKWTDASNIEHMDIVPRSEIVVPQGTAVAQRLEDAGLRCGRYPNLMRSFLIDVQARRILHTVDKSGWQRTGNSGWAYVLPTGENLASEANDVILKPTIRRSGDEMGTAGSLKEWQDAVAAYAIGNSRLAFFLSAAFAGVLLDIITEPSGGLHLVGKSRSGKSTALYIAGSVWGRGTKKAASWRATSNGLEGMAKAVNDGVLLLDEIGQADAREVGEMIYTLANGGGKARANIHGGARNRATWRIIYLSTGEIALDIKMAEANRAAATGLQVRLVNIPADAGVSLGVFENLHGMASAADLADHLRRAADTYYGTACRAFATRLADMRRDEATLQELLLQYRENFSTSHVPHGADGQVRSVAGRFALMAAAGELATELGILPWGPGEAMLAAGICFRAWLESRGHVGAGEDELVLKHLRGLLVAHGDSRFSELNSPDVSYNRLGWRRPTSDGPEYLIAKDQWDREVFRGTTIDSKRALKVLKLLGLVKKDKDRPTLKISHNGAKVNVVCIRSDILAE